jgi:DNA-binding beta-propeller fold protein YncE
MWRRVCRGLEARLAFGLAAALVAGCGEEADTTPIGSERARVQRPETENPAETSQRPRYRAFVALEDQDGVAVLTGPPWRLARTVRVATGPHNVAASPAARRVAVSSPAAGQVTILDLRGRVTDRAEPGAGAHDVDFTRSGKSLWVSAEDAGRLVKLELPSGRSVASLPTSGPPHDLDVSPDGEELWVTIDDSAAVEVRSAQSGRLLARPMLGGAPHDVMIDPGGKRVWFSNWSSPVLSVASVPRREPVGRLAVGSEPHHFGFGHGSLWVTDNVSGELLRIAPRARKVDDSTAVGAEPHHVAVAGRHVLVAVHGSGQLAIVSAEGQLLRRVDVGAGPHGVAVVRR